MGNTISDITGLNWQEVLSDLEIKDMLAEQHQENAVEEDLDYRSPFTAANDFVDAYQNHTGCMPGSESMCSGRNSRCFYYNMQHFHRDSKYFLYALDSMLDYYVGDNAPVKTTDEDAVGTLFPMVYFPDCPKWARHEVLSFLIVKFALRYSQVNLDKLRISGQIVTLPCKTNRDYVLREQEKRNWRCTLNELKKRLPQRFYSNSGGINLIVVKDSDLENLSKYDRTLQFLCWKNEENNISDSSVWLVSDMKAEDVLDYAESKHLNIENIFILYTSNAICRSFSAAYIEALETVKTCFVFDFSNNPYRLTGQLACLERRLEYFPANIAKAIDYHHYISFTAEDTEWLYNRRSATKHLFIDSDQEFFEYFGEQLDDLSYKIRKRNLFGLCWTKELRDAYLQMIRSCDQIEINADKYRECFEYAEELFKEWRHAIEHFFAGQNSVGVVTPTLDDKMKRLLKNELRKLSPRECTLHMYAFDALRERSEVCIRDKRVLVLNYRPHYLNSLNPAYPNSFDDFRQDVDGQIFLDIIQGYVFGDYYIWDEYEYKKRQARLLNKPWRQSVMDRLEVPTRPTTHRPTLDYYADDSVYSRLNTLVVRFADGSKKHLLETELVIYTTANERLIGRCREAVALYQKENKLIGIQPLADISNEIEELIKTRNNADDTQEMLCRRRFLDTDEISQAEYDSSEELWRILLRKKILRTNSQKALEDLMAPLPEKSRISYATVVNNWLSEDIKMILPLEKKLQKRVIEYVGIPQETNYLHIMRRKKMRQAAGTARRNAMINSFLTSVLLSPPDDNLLDEVINSDINEDLQIKNLDDLKFYVDELSKKINIKQVKDIKYAN